MRRIAIIGTGGVGQACASRFITLGYEVMMGTRNVSEKLAGTERNGYGNPPFSEWHPANRNVKLGTFEEAAIFGEIILNATLGIKSIAVLKSAGAKNLNGKILIDVVNPLDFSKGTPPSLLPELSNTNSLGEEIQKIFPDVKVVKTLNTMWNGLMINPAMLNEGDHTAFICGNDAEAKATVREILKSFGWPEQNILDLGDISSARGTEMHLPLWLRIFRATGSGAFNIKITSLR
ncbi:MAG: NAD(P)-binding domain-containing protein [Bacteroidales bacterium]